MPTQSQTTIAAPVSFHGHGVHGGQDCQVIIKPADADHGIRFVRTDLDHAPEIPAHIDALAEEPLMRQTILRAPEDPAVAVATVEHILAALHALGIDNVRIEMTAPEPPIGNGSATEPTTLLAQAGKKELPGAPRKIFVIDRPLSFVPEDSPNAEFVVWPSEHLTITYFLEYDHPLIGSQVASYRVDPETFASEIAPARTFCTYEEVEFLRSKGLIQGGSVENAIVIGREKILNTELLWENELARHKLLDLIGDLMLIGAPVRGHILSYRGGHHANAQFIDFLRKEHS